MAFNAIAERARMLDQSNRGDEVVSGQGKVPTAKCNYGADNVVGGQPGAKKSPATNTNKLGALMGQGGK
jgi:hypothetical protein